MGPESCFALIIISRSKGPRRLGPSPLSPSERAGYTEDMKINALFASGLLCAASASAAFAQARDFSSSRDRVGAALDAAATPGFDGGAAPAPAPLPDAPKPVKPAHTALEKNLFNAAALGYHSAFAADFATTGMVLGRGGYETDPLYTRLGKKNMSGVIGSAVALHAAATVGSLALYKEAAKTHGVKRVLLDAAAIGINAYGIGAHTQGAVHNIGVLNNWNSPKN